MDRLHREADIRAWLGAHPRAAAPYVRQRIGESYDHIGGLLEQEPPRGHARALDMGCGTAFDSFALATHFDHVTAIDASRHRILGSRLLARRAGVRHVDFRALPAESFEPDREFDFVYCNIMSEQAESRRELVARLARSAGRRGTIFYAEAVDGYPPREASSAVERRDGKELRLRLQQTIRGFCSLPGFRFYASGTAAELFAGHGFEVVRSDPRTWEGMNYVDRLWLRAAEVRTDPPASAAHDPHYTKVPAGFQAVREVYLEALRGRVPATEELIARAHGEGRFAPFLVLLAMAAEVPGAAPSDAGWFAARMRDRGPSPLRTSDPDWERLDGLVAELRSAVRQGRGAAAGRSVSGRSA